MLYSGLAIHASLESQRLLATSVLELVDTNLRFCVYNNQKVNKSSSLNLKEVLKSSESKYADDLKELETRYKVNSLVLLESYSSGEFIRNMRERCGD